MKNFGSNVARLLCFTLVSGLFLCGSCDGFLGIYVQDEESEESVREKAVSVTEARIKTGEKGVWVTGVIVGGDLSSSKVKFEGPFKSATCLAIARDSSCTVRDSCMSVQLPKGDIRDALNLPDHPDFLGKRIYVKGDIVSSYYGLPGIQNISLFF